MVLGIIASDGKRMLSIFFDGNEKLNTKMYYPILCYQILLWLKLAVIEASSVGSRPHRHQSAEVAGHKLCGVLGFQNLATLITRL